MFGLFKYFRDYRKECIAAPLLKLLEALLELSVPLIVANIIDVGLPSADGSYVWKMCGLMALCGAVGLAVSFVSQYFSARAAVGFAGKVRSALCRKTLYVDREHFESLGGSTLLTRLTSDVDRLQNGVNLALRLLLRSPLIVFGSVAMAFITDVETGWIFLGAVPILAAVIFAVVLLGMPLYSRVQAKLDELTLRTRENLRGVRVIRAFRHEDDEVVAFDSVNREHTRRSVFAERISSLLNPLTYVIVNFAIILIIKVGAPAVNSGRLGTGEVVALYNYMAQILTELIKLANLIVTMTKSAACASRINAALSVEDRDGESGAEAFVEGAPAVEFRNVGFRYRGAAGDALSPVSFSANKGEIVGILGGTGSGKTTLCELIPRFYDATCGEVSVGGVSVRDWNVGALRRKVAVVPQYARLFSGTVAENVRWGAPGATDEEVARALEAADALDFVMSKKNGLYASVEAGGGNFSGGQRQRLTIARALVGKPEVLIFDDSFSALDYATEHRIRRNITELEQKPTVIIVSQRPSSVMEASRIIVLDDGDAVGIGTHDELMKDCAVYREIYESQYGDGKNEQ